MTGICTKCNKEKELSEFYKDKCPRGYSYHCKSCISERSKERTKEIRAEVIEWTNELYNGEELNLQLEAISKLNSKKLWNLRAKLNKLLGEKFDHKSYHKEYYQKNKEKLRKQNKEYAQRNKEKIYNYKKVYTAENKERDAENKRRWTESNYAQVKLSSVLHRARKNNIPFDLDLSDLDFPEICPILKLPLRIAKNGGSKNNSPSIDKIIPDVGYVKDNVQIISNRANKMKSDATPLELILFAAWVLDNFDIEDYMPELDEYVATQSLKEG